MLATPGNGNGNIDTIHSFSNSDFGLETVVKNIEKDKVWSKNPAIILVIKNQTNKTPEQYVKERSRDYIVALSTKKNISEFNNDLLYNLIKQEALRQLYEKAEKSTIILNSLLLFSYEYQRRRALTP